MNIFNSMLHFFIILLLKNNFKKYSQKNAHMKYLVDKSRADN